MTIEIRTLEPGEKITENGFYNIPLHVHHNQPCDGVSVTSGVLRTVELDSPAGAWAYSKLNPKARVKKQTQAMILGGAMAALIAGGDDELKRQFGCLKPGTPKRPTDLQWAAYREGRANNLTTIKACKTWDILNNDPRPKITFEERQELYEMAEVLRNDPAAVAAMEGLPEITMAVWDEESRIWLLSRPDTVSPEHALISDYKRMASTSGALNTRLVDTVIEREGYGMQLGLGADVFNRLTGNMPSENWIVAQWTTYPFHVIPRGIPEEALLQDIFRNRRAVRTIRECLDSGHWPGPGEDVGNYRRSKWQSERLQEEMQSEGFTL